MTAKRTETYVKIILAAVDMFKKSEIQNKY